MSLAAVLRVGMVGVALAVVTSELASAFSWGAGSWTGAGATVVGVTTARSPSLVPSSPSSAKVMLPSTSKARKAALAPMAPLRCLFVGMAAVPVVWTSLVLMPW